MMVLPTEPSYCSLDVLIGYLLTLVNKFDVGSYDEGARLHESQRVRTSISGRVVRDTLSIGGTEILRTRELLL